MYFWNYYDILFLAGNEKANTSTSNTSTTTASSANPAPPAPVASGTTPTPPPPGMVVPVATGSQTPKKDSPGTGNVSPDDSALLMSPTTRILPREQLQLVKGGNLPRVPDCFQRTPKKVTLQSLATGNFWKKNYWVIIVSCLSSSSNLLLYHPFICRFESTTSDPDGWWPRCSCHSKKLRTQ